MSDDADDWWRLDGTVDWAVNPGGQIVELGLDSEGWTVTIFSPFTRRQAFTFRSPCKDQAGKLYAALTTLEAPAAKRALARWRSRRARRDHPSSGE